MNARGVAVALSVALALLPAAGSADAPDRCLPPAAATVVESFLKSGPALPAGWSWASASLQRDRIVLALSGPDGASAALVLAPPGGTGARAAGRHFGVEFPEAPAGIPDRVALGLALDGAFAESPWAPCGGTARPPSPDGAPAPAPAPEVAAFAEIPAWAALALGLAQIALVAFVTVRGFRRDPAP